ncbi:MAG: AbrB/MazE/SpoVT family DNA-binding domain-containing protein [Caldilineaceae bacterium]|nr:AbrB/MazE/SpoVT family DNA-binding domain-containing protein [Caldilineaceae bacterium]
MADYTEHIRTLTTKGQVTIPAEIRRLLRLEPNDQVIFRVIGDQVQIEAAPMSLEEAFGSVPPLQQPENFREMRAIAREERVQRAVANDTSAP